MNTYINKLLCTRACEIIDMLSNADGVELNLMSREWQKEYDEIQACLKEDYPSLKAHDVVLVLYSLEGLEYYSSTHIHGTLTNEEVLTYIQNTNDVEVTIHHIAR